ncbi:hypothetical protein HYQ46_001241 [Verticillium longisporum]|nr:hypothetical protein HYQ46_001241 [Verticillium longisporum]
MSRSETPRGLVPATKSKPNVIVNKASQATSWASRIAQPKPIPKYTVSSSSFIGELRCSTCLAPTFNHPPKAFNASAPPDLNQS